MSYVSESDSKSFIYDWGTANYSFVKMYKTLKQLGIKNNKFFLKLYDKSLQGVDPHSKKLTTEQKARILQEVIINPWYYLREVVRIPEAGGTIKFQLHRGNLALVWAMLMNLNAFLLLPRQNGKTVSAIAMYTWIYHFSTKNSNILFGNKEFGDSKLNVKRFKDMVEQLPIWLKETIISTRNDTDNIELIISSKNNNTVKAVPSANDPVKADKLGRGNTSPLFYWDEFAFLKFNDIIYGSAAPAQSKAQEAAARNGRPYGKIFTTTPNNLDIPEGKFAKKMIDDACPFEESMYDWPLNKVMAYIEANSGNDFIHIQFSYKELGLSEAWFKKQCRALNNDLFLIKREILLEWTIASDTSPFTEEQLEEMKNFVIPATGKLFLRDVFKFNFYKDIDKDTNWLIGVDVAGGLMRDNSAITISHPETLEIHADFKNNQIDSNDMFMVLVELVMMYFPNSVLIIERNSYGLPLINRLLQSPVSKNLYYEITSIDGKKKVGSMAATASVKTKTQVYGVNTTSKTRDLMVNELLKMIVNDQPHCITSENVYNDIKNLERKKTGKIEHRDGEHDDTLMSYLFSRYVIAYGTNLSRFMIGNSSDGRNMQEFRGDVMRNMRTLSLMNREDRSYNMSEEFIMEQATSNLKAQGRKQSSIMSILNMNN